LMRWPPCVRVRAGVRDGDSVPYVRTDLLGHMSLAAGRRAEDADAASGAAGARKAPASARLREQHEGPVGPSWVMLELGDRVCSCFDCGAVPTTSDDEPCCCCSCRVRAGARSHQHAHAALPLGPTFLSLKQQRSQTKQDSGLEREEEDSAELRPWMEGHTEELTNEDMSTVIALARYASPTHSPLLTPSSTPSPASPTPHIIQTCAFLHWTGT
jgi:hypothetical protein